MNRRLAFLAASAGLLGAFTCSKRAAVDMPDIVVPPPSARQLELWNKEFEGGGVWRGDPRRVAHEEIQEKLDVPWKGEPFDPGKYQFTEVNPEKPEWGSYVIRRFIDMSGRVVSYQVQVSRHGKVWYARKVRHYYAIDMAHPALEDKERRRH